MKTRLKLLGLLAFLSLSSASLLNAQNSTNPPLRITRGGVDTIYSAKHIVLGVTSPNAKVTVNGEGVKVYKTGSFGWQGNLNVGDNELKISSIVDGKISTKILNIYRSTAPARRPVREEPKYELIDTTFIVETLEGAYFNYGDGTDRLGGAKVSFLDEGIPLKVVQEYANLYKVQVSQNRYYHIPKSYVEPSDKEIKLVNSGSWRLTGGEDRDRLTISLGAHLPYVVRQELDPNAIIVDIFGARCNSNWLTQKEPFGIVDYIDLEQVEYDVLRVKIVLKSRSWGTRISYDGGGNLSIVMKHAPAPTLEGMTIGVDAGHGGPRSNGAISISGLKEKDLNLDMAYLLKKELENRGAKVVLSRAEDVDVPMDDRKKCFIDADADIVVSIHCNAGGSPFAVMGASTYYKWIHNRDLALSVLKRIKELDGVGDFGLVGNFNFSLNAPIEFPNILVETQFLSNLPDEERIADPAFRKAMMIKVVDGIEDYLKSQE